MGKRKIPSWQKEVAEKVHQMAFRDGGLAVFHERLRDWDERETAQFKRRNCWLEERQALIEDLAKMPEDHPRRVRTQGPPEEGLVWTAGETKHCITDEVSRVEGWMPGRWRWEWMPKPDALMPLTTRSLSIAEKYVLLAALHNTSLKGTETFDSGRSLSFWHDICPAIEEGELDDAETEVRVFLADVERHLNEQLGEPNALATKANTKEQPWDGNANWMEFSSTSDFAKLSPRGILDLIYDVRQMIGDLEATHDLSEKRKLYMYLLQAEPLLCMGAAQQGLDEKPIRDMTKRIACDLSNAGALDQGEGMELIREDAQLQEGWALARIQIANRWVKCLDRLETVYRLAESGAPAQATGEKSQLKSELRHWTQADLDKAIRQYKAKRSQRYAELVEAVQKGKPGAIKTARKMFGRNVIVKALGVRSPDMVSRSPAWIAIAKDLGFRLARDRIKGTRRTSKPGRIGHEIASEAQSQNPAGEADNRPSDAPLLQAEGEETLRHIRRLAESTQKGMKEQAEAILEKYDAGKMTDEQARETVRTLLKTD